MFDSSNNPKPHFNDINDLITAASKRSQQPHHPRSKPPTPLPPDDSALPRKSRTTPKRTRQVVTRFNQKEYTLFLKRLERSHLPQGEYLRQMALAGQVTVVDHSELLIAVLDTLSDIQTTLGKQNGMLKMIIRPNEGQRQLAPDEWATLIDFLRKNEAATRAIGNVREVLNGHTKT